MAKKIAVASESQEQKAYFQWVRLMQNQDKRYNLIFAIPNGAWLGAGAGGKVAGRCQKCGTIVTSAFSASLAVRKLGVANKLKAEGLEPGVPDLFIAVPMFGFGGAFIEMKRKGGTISGRQDKWLSRLSAVGYAVKVAEGFDEAREFTEKYLRGDYD